MVFMTGYRFTPYFENEVLQTMNLKYYEDMDSLYIDLSVKPSAESREVSEGIVLDYDSEGNLVGIDIDNASRKLDLAEINLTSLPVHRLRPSA